MRSDKLYGAGVKSKGKYGKYIDGVMTPEYQLWKNMITRCYSEAYKSRKSNYDECYCSDMFLDFQLFSEWCNNQIGFNRYKWHLDKDILVKGNKIYSENTCVFVPQEINKIILKNDAIRGDLPLGVSWCKRDSLFAVYMKVRSKTMYIGKYPTKESAFAAYKRAKERHIQNVIKEFKDELDPRAYKALMSYTIDIGD